MHCTELCKAAFRGPFSAAGRKAAKKFTCSENCSEKVKLWAWSNSSDAAECLNWTNCFGRTLKCCIFDVLKHKCKEQEKVH